MKVAQLNKRTLADKAIGLEAYPRRIHPRICQDCGKAKKRFYPMLIATIPRSSKYDSSLLCLDCEQKRRKYVTALNRKAA